MSVANLSEVVGGGFESILGREKVEVVSGGGHMSWVMVGHDNIAQRRGQIDSV